MYKKQMLNAMLKHTQIRYFGFLFQEMKKNESASIKKQSIKRVTFQRLNEYKKCFPNKYEQEQT